MSSCLPHFQRLQRLPSNRSCSPSILLSDAECGYSTLRVFGMAPLERRRVSYLFGPRPKELGQLHSISRAEKSARLLTDRGT
eukprot:157495-Amphidinium_carterae.1